MWLINIFLLILVCIFNSLTNGVVVDTSPQSASGEFGIADKHRDLLDLIMEERRSRSQLEQYVKTLHTTISRFNMYVSEINIETTDLKANYNILLKEHFELKNKLASFEYGSATLVSNTSITQENNDTNRLEKLIQITQKQVNILLTDNEARKHDVLVLYNLTLSNKEDLIKSQLEAKSEKEKSRSYVETGFQNLSFSQAAIATILNNLQHQMAKTAENVGFTACGAQRLDNLFKFTSIKTVYGINNIDTLETSGQFICEQAGLYLIIARLMSQDEDALFYITKNFDIIFGFVQITPAHVDPSYHTGTGSAVVQLDVGDVIYISAIPSVVVFPDYSCLSAVKIT